MGALHEDKFTSFIVSGLFLLRMENVSGRNCKEKTHVLCSITFFFFENRTLYEIMWKNVQLGRSHMAIWRMRNACWIPKATNTHSEYVIFIAFPRQNWFH